MRERLRRSETAGEDKHVTAREIRTLLTKLGDELVQELESTTAQASKASPARMIPTRRFVESMSGFLRMN